MHKLIRIFYSLKTTLYSLYSFSEEECRRTRQGAGYQGTQSITVDGNQCLPWSSPIVKDQLAEAKTSLNYSLEENYCRSPILFSRTDTQFVYSFRPWCYSKVDRIIRDSACDVPYCGMYRSIPGCSQTHKIGNNPNIGIKGFTT